MEDQMARIAPTEDELHEAGRLVAYRYLNEIEDLRERNPEAVPYNFTSWVAHDVYQSVWVALRDVLGVRRWGRWKCSWTYREKRYEQVAASGRCFLLFMARCSEEICDLLLWSVRTKETEERAACLLLDAALREECPEKGAA